MDKLGNENVETALYRQILEHIADVVYMLEGERISLLSGLADESAAEVADIPVFLERVHEEDRQRIAWQLQSLSAADGVEMLECRWLDSGGEWNWMEIAGVPLPAGPSGMPRYALVLRNVSTCKRIEEQLRNMAFLDSLTELPNRRLFEHQFRQTIAQAQRGGQALAILYLDIDDFKWINDTYGHVAGDEFLKLFAARVKQCVREIDTFARMGGDEFVVLLPQIDSVDNLHKVAGRIMSAVRREWIVSGHRLHVSISMGVAVFPHDGADSETMLRHVDEALYRVKKNGRNGYVFYSV